MMSINYKYQSTMGAQRQFRSDTILQVRTVVVNDSKFTGNLPEYQCIYNVNSSKS